MDDRLTRITLRGFKSIRSLEDFELRPLNVLIGPNGAGKSNFIGFFRLLAEILGGRLQFFVQQQGGPDALLFRGRKATGRMEIELYFGNNGYLAALAPSIDNRLIFDYERSWFGGYFRKADLFSDLGRGHPESLLKEVEDSYSVYVVRALTHWRVYHFHDTGETARVKQRHPVSDNLRLKPDGANLAAFLRMLRQKYRQHYDRILETLRLVAPFFGDFVHREDLGEGDSLDLEWTERFDPDTPYKAAALSDGTLRFACLCTLLLQPEELLPHTVLLDEPELGLHPYALNVLGDLLRRASEDRQLIVSTQSADLLNTLQPEDVVVVDRIDGASSFRRLDGTSLVSWLEDYSLGDLWKSNVLGGRPRG